MAVLHPAGGAGDEQQSSGALPIAYSMKVPPSEQDVARKEDQMLREVSLVHTVSAVALFALCEQH